MSMSGFLVLLTTSVLCISLVAPADESESGKKVSHLKTQDLTELQPYLLVVSMVPTDEDEAAIGSGKDSKNYTTWLEGMEQRLKDAYEFANLEMKKPDDAEPSVKIMEVELRKLENSNNLKIVFYVSRPPEGNINSKKVQDVYGALTADQMWQKTGRKELTYPAPVDAEVDQTSRTLSIIAFVMGWVCLAALVVILAYLGIKYRDGIKSLARRIEQWSNPNRNGYSNLGGENVQDWRTEEAVPEPRTYTAEDQKPKKKLRPPGGLLTDVDETEAGFAGTQKQSYGTYQEGTEMTTVNQPAKDTTQVRLSDLAQKDGEQTPPLTPTSMQKHLIKKYQDKQAEEQVRGDDQPLTASNSEVFPDDFADCVEEEEIFQIKP